MFQLGLHLLDTSSVIQKNHRAYQNDSESLLLTFQVSLTPFLQFILNSVAGVIILNANLIFILLKSINGSL